MRSCFSRGVDFRDGGCVGSGWGEIKRFLRWENYTIVVVLVFISFAVGSMSLMMVLLFGFGKFLLQNWIEFMFIYNDIHQVWLIAFFIELVGLPWILAM